MMHFLIKTSYTYWRSAARLLAGFSSTALACQVVLGSKPEQL
jgi:hypothetical protein